MFPIALRICLILIALVFIFMVIRNVNQRKLLLQYSLSWLLLSLAMIAFALFPQIASFFSQLIKIKEPSNFVYAVGLFVLLFMTFDFTGKVSKQSVYLRTLIQQEAINRHLIEENKKDDRQ